MSVKSRAAKTESVLVLHDIRSVHNVGAMFRTADAAGVSRVVLSGYTPTPVDRFGRVRDDFAKAALGSERSVAWSYAENPEPVIATLKDEGFSIVGVEQDTNSIDYKEYEPGEKIAILMGTETTGMDASLMRLCDAIVELPMRGTKESLNVSVAAGIVLYRLLDR